jgi:hypothetical protein
MHTSLSNFDSDISANVKSNLKEFSWNKRIRILKYLYKTKILNTFFRPCLARFRIFVSKNKKVPAKRKLFLLKTDHYGCQNVQNFMQISDLREHFRINTPKMKIPKKCFFLQKKSSEITVFGITFSWNFLTDF